MNSLKIILLLVLLMLSACAANDIKLEDVPQNQPASNKFSDYKYVFIKPLTISANYQDIDENRLALSMLEEELFKRMLTVFLNLSDFRSYDALKPEKTLIIVPHVEKMHSESSTKQLWLGKPSDKAEAILKVTFIDAVTNKTIAEPIFYQHSSISTSELYMHEDWHKDNYRDGPVFYRISRLVADYCLKNL